MTKIKQFYLVFIIIIIIIFLLAFIAYIIQSKPIKNKLDDNRELTDKKQELGDFFINTTDSITDVNNIKISFSKITNSTNLLFVFSEFNCEACVDQQFEILNNLSKKTNIKIIGLAINYQHRNFKIFKQSHKPIFPLYNFETDNLADLNSPIYFLISKELQIKSTYNPVIEFPEKTIHYIKSSNKLINIENN